MHRSMDDIAFQLLICCQISCFFKIMQHSFADEGEGEFYFTTLPFVTVLLFDIHVVLIFDI